MQVRYRAALRPDNPNYTIAVWPQRRPSQRPNMSVLELPAPNPARLSSIMFLKKQQS